MSQINTTGIDTTYPVAGVNNNSQGFRDNFTAIKTALDEAKAELTDIQSKAVVTSALATGGPTTINNLAGNPLSNAKTNGARGTFTNIAANTATGILTVDVNSNDAYSAVVSSNITLDFTRWSPAGTRSVVDLILNYDGDYTITLPTSDTSSFNSSVDTLENYDLATGIITWPLDATTGEPAASLHYRFSSTDCGTTITVEPINRPRQAAQFVTSNVLPSVNNSTAGDIVFVTNSNVGSFNGFDGTNWISLASSSGNGGSSNGATSSNTTLSGNTVITGNVAASANISLTGANVTLGAVGNLHITGGSANQVLRTDGAGGLSWYTPAAGGGTGTVTSVGITSNTLSLGSTTSITTSGVFNLEVQAAQPNITSVGTLTSLAVSGSTVLPTANIANIRFPDGTSLTSGANASATANGYCYLPGGILMQWGSGPLPINQANTAFTFPTPFANACYNITATLKVNSAPGGTWSVDVIGNPTTTGFILIGDYDTNSGTANVYWQAIGK